MNNRVLKLIKGAQSKNKLCTDVIGGTIEDFREQELEVRDGVVLKVLIPDDRVLCTKLLELYHDSPISGHLGVKKTIELIRRACYWNLLEKDVSNWVGSCVTCQKNKSSTQKPIGLLKSIETPSRNWEVIHLDFIGPLPVSGRSKFDTILTILSSTSK